jgi:hypothetical protein
MSKITSIKEADERRAAQREHHKAQQEAMQRKQDTAVSGLAALADANNRNSDEIEKSGLTGREKVEALYASYDTYQAAVKKAEEEAQDIVAQIGALLAAQQKESEELESYLKQEVAILSAEEAAAALAAAYEEPEQNDTSKEDAANQDIFQTLTGLGIKAETLATALGIEPKEVREKKRADEKAERDRLREEWKAGQESDRLEREKLRSQVTAPAPAPAPAPVDNSGDVKVEIVTLEPTRLVINYTNTTKSAASLKIRVGSTDRPDRLVAAGKVATSAYTTTSKGGFKGQRVLVGWIEKNTTVFDRVL